MCAALCEVLEAIQKVPDAEETGILSGREALTFPEQDDPPHLAAAVLSSRCLTELFRRRHCTHATPVSVSLRGAKGDQAQQAPRRSFSKARAPKLSVNRPAWRRGLLCHATGPELRDQEKHIRSRLAGSCLRGGGGLSSSTFPRRPESARAPCRVAEHDGYWAREESPGNRRSAKLARDLGPGAHSGNE